MINEAHAGHKGRAGFVLCVSWCVLWTKQIMKRLGLFALIFLLSCTFSAAQENTIERGRDLLKHGSYKEAAVVFTALLAKNANDEQAQQGLVRTLIETGDYRTAESKSKEYLNARPKDGAMRVALGDVLFATGRYSEAVPRVRAGRARQQVCYAIARVAQSSSRAAGAGQRRSIAARTATTRALLQRERAAHG